MSEAKKPIRLSLANGALLQAPIWEQHYLGSNWLSVIDVDGTMPGGLARRFLPRGKGECLFLVEQVSLFDAIEFAADYTTSVGRKHKKRWFGVVVGKTDDALSVLEFETGATAVVHAKAMRVDPRARAWAMSEERETLLRKANELQQAIEELSKEPVDA